MYPFTQIHQLAAFSPMCLFTISLFIYMYACSMFLNYLRVRSEALSPSITKY